LSEVKPGTLPEDVDTMPIAIQKPVEVDDEDEGIDETVTVIQPRATTSHVQLTEAKPLTLPRGVRKRRMGFEVPVSLGVVLVALGVAGFVIAQMTGSF
jgi:hypothetical protein